METTYLGIGSNLGDRLKNIIEAIENLSNWGRITKISSVWETSPWGSNNQPYFLNCAIEYKTKLSPQELLNKISIIEKTLGRCRTDKKYASRIIDIDILFYNSFVIKEENLTVPHPLLHMRKFVLLPLKEIAENFVHPVIKKSIKILLEEITSDEVCTLVTQLGSEINKEPKK